MGYALQVSLEQKRKHIRRVVGVGQQPASNTGQEALRMRRKASGDMQILASPQL